MKARVGLLGVLCFAIGGAVPHPGVPGGTADAAEGFPPPLRVRDSLVEDIVVSRSGQVALRERRSLLASARFAPGAEALAEATEQTRIGFRVGGIAVEGVVGDDLSWRPGRRSARIAPEGGEGAVLRLRWSPRGVVRARLRDRGRAAYADGFASGPAGAVEAPLEAAARFGDAGFRFGGSVSGDASLRTVTVLDGDVSLSRVRLSGTARLLGLDEDSVPPRVVVTDPAQGAVIRDLDPVTVAGTLADDRSLASLSVSVDGGASIDVPFQAAPGSGFLGDALGSFSFPLPASEGTHRIEVTVRDAAGNAASSSVVLSYHPVGSAPMAAGRTHVAAVGSDGRLYAWGTAFLPRLTGSAPPVARTPVLVPGLEGVSIRSVACGWNFTIALAHDGTVWAFGVNEGGECAEPSLLPVAAARRIESLGGIVQVAAGQEFAMALGSDGTVYSWGRNTLGQLGRGATDNEAHPDPRPVPGLPPAAFLATGWYTAYAVDAQGSVSAWGFSLGFGTALGAPAPSPVPIAGIDGVKAMGAGPSFALFVRGDGELWAIGYSQQGECGFPGKVTNTVPTRVPGVEGVASVAGGQGVSTVILEDGSLLLSGWGYHPFGSVAPVDFASHGLYSIFVRTGDGTVLGRGSNYYGQLGIGSDEEFVPEFTPVDLP